MKRVGLTMRVDRYSSLNQRTDAIDQRWFCFLKKCDLFPVLLPNNDYYTRYIMIIHYNIIETILIYFLVYPYRPRILPENFNDYIFNDLDGPTVGF